MKLPRIPAGVPALVTAVAVGNRHTTKRLVGNVINRRAIRRRESTGVAGRTLVSYRHLPMVPACRLPSARSVATDAIHTGRNVGGGLASGGAAVVTACTVGGTGESSMVHTRRRQPTGRLVAGAT